MDADALRGRSFPFHRLPPQIIEAVVQQLSSPQDVARLLLVSKSVLQCVKECHLRIKLNGRSGIVGPSEMETVACRRILISLTKQFSRIESLDLSWTNLTDSDIIDAVKKLPSLRLLSLSNCTKITDALPSVLYHGQTTDARLPCLESLQLARCFQLTDTSLIQILSWSVTPGHQLRAAAFGKISVPNVIRDGSWQRLMPQFRHAIESQGAALNSDPVAAFQWSTLRILCLNNVEKFGPDAFGVIVGSCPNLAVLGLGGSLLLELSGHLLANSRFIEAYEVEREQHQNGQTNHSGSVTSRIDRHVIDYLTALLLCLPRLWLLELTFCPHTIINALRRKVSNGGALKLSPQQSQALCFVDFGDAGSVIEFQTRIVEPFRRYLKNAQRQTKQDCLDDWRFDKFPESFLEFMIDAASCTARGGSMLAPTTPYVFSHTPLHCAAESGDAEHVRALINLGVVLELRGRGGGSPLFKAAKEGHVSVVLLLLEAQINPLTANRHDETSLYISALKGHKKIVDLILSFCAFHDVDWKQSAIYRDGWSPLMAAAVADHCTVAKCILCAAGADAANFVCMKNRYKQTALHIAAYRGCEKMVRLLVNVGGLRLMKEVDSYGRCALAIARSQGRDAVERLLMERSLKHQSPLPEVDFQARWRQWVKDRDCALNEFDDCI